MKSGIKILSLIGIALFIIILSRIDLGALVEYPLAYQYGSSDPCPVGKLCRNHAEIPEMEDHRKLC